MNHKATCSEGFLYKQNKFFSRETSFCSLALNRIKIKIRSTTQKKKNKNQNKNTKLENCQQPYLVVPYYQGLSESVKRTCNKYGVQVYFKGGVTIKSLLMEPKVVSSTNIQVIGWSVMKNTLVSLPEILVKGSKNIKRPHPPYLTTIPSLVITSN